MKRKALTFVQIGAWVMSLFGGFYSNIAPPDDSLKFWPSFASMLAGLGFIGYWKLGQKPRTVIVSIAIVFAALFPIFYYWRYQNLTERYSSSRVICGTEFTRHAEEYVSSHPGISKERLIFDFGGKTTDIWTEASINRARLTLGLSYSAGFGFFALAILSVLQESKRPPSQYPLAAGPVLARLEDLAKHLNQSTATLVDVDGSRRLAVSPEQEQATIADLNATFANALRRARISWRISLFFTIVVFIIIATMVVLAVVLSIKSGVKQWGLIFGSAAVPLVLGVLVWKPFDKLFAAAIQTQQIELISIRTVAGFRGTTLVEDRKRLCTEALDELRKILQPQRRSSKGLVRASRRSKT